jgi:hypothetical protein
VSVARPAWGLPHLELPEDTILAYGARLLDTRAERLTILGDRSAIVTPCGDLDLCVRGPLIRRLDKFWRRARRTLRKEISPSIQSYKVYACQEQDGGQWFSLACSQCSSDGYVYLTVYVTNAQCALPEDAKIIEPQPKSTKKES